MGARSRIQLASDEGSQGHPGEKSEGQDESDSAGVSLLLGRLLERCENENDAEVKNEVARCLGEIGVVDPKRINVEGAAESYVSEDARDLQWRMKHAPWRSELKHYALKILTNRLVVSLKAAMTGQEQDKVGFAIQEVLKILNGTPGSDAAQGGMNESLTNQLSEKGVLTTVDPFWYTSFKRADDPRQIKPEPPFFSASVSYQRWMSKWCRHLIDKSAANEQSSWRSLFTACSSVSRAEAGVR